VDFDGVLHSYTTPWVNPHVIPDPPVDGAILWLWETIQDFDVVILSTRCKSFRGRAAMRRWLRDHSGLLYVESPDGHRGIEDVQFAKAKPPALIYIDDRGYRFTGPQSWPTVRQIHRWRPWNK
jgi:hypothetical protein